MELAVAGALGATNLKCMAAGRHSDDVLEGGSVLKSCVDLTAMPSHVDMEEDKQVGRRDRENKEW